MMGRWFGGRRRRASCPLEHGGSCEAAPESAVCRFKSLGDAAPGTRCRVRCLHGGGGIRQRLLDHGIVPGIEATVLRSAPLLDPIEIRIGDSFITLRRTEAALVGIDDA